MPSNLGGSKGGGKTMPCGHSKCPSLRSGLTPQRGPPLRPNDDRDYQQLEQYQEALLGGMKEGRKKA
jgi:hypothetical protein